MRRALSVLVAVFIVVAAAFIVTPRVEAQRLGRQLLADVTVLRTREMPRATPVREPIHDNGFLCLAGMLKVTPRDLAPFDVPGDFTPTESTPKQLNAVAAWADNLRACGESRWLRFALGAAPWDDGAELVRVALALSRITALQVRDDLAKGRAVEASLRCQATYAAAFDWTRLGPHGVVGALGLSRQLLPACADALRGLPAEVRVDASQTWGALLPRVVTLRELLETTRVAASVRNFGGLSGVEGLPPPVPRVPAASALERFEERRLWPKWDAAFRHLVDAPDAAARDAAVKQLDALVGGVSPVTIDARLQEHRLQQLATISMALTWFAGGAAGNPPVGERTDAGLVLPLEPSVTLPLDP